MIDPLPPGARRNILWGWALLAVLSLALAGLALIVPVLSKMPFLENAVAWPIGFFQKGLVAHVVLSFAVWYLAVFAFMAQLTPGAPSNSEPETHPLDAAGLALAAGGTLLIITPMLLNRGQPTLNNYIPAIIDPLFYTGLACFAGGVMVAVTGMLAKLYRKANESGSDGTALMSSGLIYIAVLAAFIVTFFQLSGRQVDHDFNEILFWGGGHMLQFLNLALLIVALNLLARSGLGDMLAPPMMLNAAVVVCFIGAITGLSFYGFFPVGSENHLSAFTDLQYLMAVPALIVAAGLYLGRARWRVADFSRADVLALVLAVIVFASGGALGFIVDGADTRTPAHYHGVIGGINLAFYGIFYTWFLTALGRKAGYPKLVRAQLVLYAAGQLLFIGGLFVAGGMGAARKTMGAGIELDSLSAKIALNLRDFGLAMAILATALFVLIILAALFRRQDEVI
ncbi:MAG: cbb3-type cytochrome c oxidase subunit I [Rhodospirillales bacterium]|nr:cbb3-type cytochrome c oxidase subunit I [Rhodospirillales bacterium]